MAAILHHAIAETQTTKQMQPTDTQTPDESSPTGLIRVSGADRIDFLQGQLTQDLRQLQPGKPLLAGWTSAKGRLLCVCWAIDWQDSIWLLLPEALVAPTVKRLRMFVLRAAAKVEAVDGATPISELPPEAAGLLENESKEEAVTYCIKKDISVMMPPGADAAAVLLHPGETRQPTPATCSEWRLAAIRAGIPSVWPATLESFVPQMVNMDLLQAISFSKGCYVGQEIVARTHHLGRIKRRMLRFAVTAELSGSQLGPGAPVYSGNEEIGQVVDAAPADGQYELLAVIRIEAAQQAMALQPEGTSALQRLPLPYPIPELSE